MPRPARRTRPQASLRRALPTGLLLAACVRGSAPAAPATPVVPRATPGAAAPSDTIAASRARAQALLARAIDALGGRDAVLGLAGFELELDALAGRGNWAQARRWTDTVPNAVPTRLRQLVDLRGARALNEFLSTSPGPIQFRYRSQYDSAGFWTVDLMRWRAGDDLQRGGVAGARANLAALARQLPQGAVRQAMLADSALCHVGADTRDGRPIELLTYPDPGAPRLVTLAIDAVSGRPVHVSAGGVETGYDDYRDVRGAPVPFRRVQRADGVVVGTQLVTRVDLQPPLDAARFAVPAGYAEPPAPGAPRATRVAAGIYRLDDMPGGYHAAFVVGDDGVSVLEAPFSPAYGDAALRLIAETAPGRPVTRVLVTHHHADHVGGLAPYVARGAVVVVGAGLEEAVRRQLPDSLRSRVRFETVTARRSFGSGASRVEALPVPNGHADGNVAYFLPATGVLFQGDLFYIPERGAVPPAFSVTDDLARATSAAGLRVRQVIGVHGRTGTWDEVEASRRRAARAGR
jgi:glyoxylase-like metal-dependent hydrolase (beta-lactamase superfamily II)